MDNNKGSHSGPMRFKSVLQADVPKGRDGKHKQIILRLLNDLGQLSAGSALKIPISELPDTKENIRSALSRAARQKKIDLATSSDEEFLYVWKTGEEVPLNGDEPERSVNT
jgi:catechol 2,3-dioxygenase-like lactoylglutathione lyase family enzyme